MSHSTIPKFPKIQRLLATSLSAFLCLATLASGETSLIGKVCPMMGTDLDGRTVPIAARPFGMVQLGPDTYYVGCGYHWTHNKLQSISHTHVTGNGGGDMQDICFLPIAKEHIDGGVGWPRLETTLDHTQEHAEPGYYSLFLPDEDVRVELTATERCGLHRYTFPAGKEQIVCVDLKRGNASRATTLPERFCDTVRVSHLEIIDSYTIRGYRITHGWAPIQHCYFYARMNKPFAQAVLYNNQQPTESHDITSRDCRAMLRFEADGEPLEVQVGISAVSMEGAQRNWQSEAAGRTFDQVKTETQQIWERELACFTVEGPESDEKKFYTCLYFTLLYPQLYSDVDGQYRSSDAQVYRSPHTYYAGCLGLWDIYRNHAPLIATLHPEVTRELMHTFLLHYRHCGILPMWTIAGQENDCMTGYHAMPIIADAMARGLVGQEIARPLVEAMAASARRECFGYFDSDFRGARYYMRYHYVPLNYEAHSASKTMEYSYDDWCIAQAARMQGMTDIETEFAERGTWWRNLYDPEMGFINARDTLGRFRRPFDPFSPAPAYFQSDFCEGNSWQYTFFVPQDPEGLIATLGGKRRFIARLDSLFATPTPNQPLRCFGRIGQYHHENEPVHHVAYLYTFAGVPWRTQQLVSEVMHNDYNTSPQGLCGNDDTGQMSAWFIQSAMGLFSFNHGTGLLTLGTPLFPRMQLRHPGGMLTILAPGVSAERCVVKSVSIDGQRWKGWTVPINRVFEGNVVIEFHMGSHPEKPKFN